MRRMRSSSTSVPPPVKAVQKTQGVHDFDVVGIAVVGLGEGATTVDEPVDPQQVDAERGVGAPQVGVELDRPFELGDGFPVASRDDVEVGQGLEQFAVAGMDCERLGFPGLGTELRRGRWLPPAPSP